MCRGRPDDLARSKSKEETIMLTSALAFFILALVAAILGFWGLAGLAAAIAKIVFIVFLVLFALRLLADAVRSEPHA
jgi:uncharacterized membrane protein YtjA (UPF0391 family)